MQMVSYRGNGIFRTSGGFEFDADQNFFLVPRSEIEDVSAVSLQKAVDLAWTKDKVFAGDLWIADVSGPGFDLEKVSLGELADVRIDYFDGEAEVVVNVPFTVEDPDQSFHGWIPEVLAPLLERLDATVAVGPDTSESEEFSIVARITMSPTGRSVADFLKAGEDAKALVDAVSTNGPVINLDMAVELVKTGHAQALLGLPENDWLDGKRSPYIFNGDKPRIEFSKDVAAFANSAQGGMLLIGAATRATANGDEIAAINDVNLALVNIAQMRAILRERLYPPVQGLEVLALESATPGYGLVLVHVPVQPTMRKPFLVKGAASSKGILANHISIPVRSGEDTAYSTIHEIHALIQAGRVTGDQ